MDIYSRLGASTLAACSAGVPPNDAKRIDSVSRRQIHVPILRDPTPHAGNVYPLYGPVEMNHYEIAEEMTKALGRPVTYQPIDLEMFKKRLDTDPKFSTTFAQHLLAVAVDYQNGIFAGTNGLVEELSGEPPLSVEAFIRTHAAKFSDS